MGAWSELVASGSASGARDRLPPPDPHQLRSPPGLLPPSCWGWGHISWKWFRSCRIQSVSCFSLPGTCAVPRAQALLPAYRSRTGMSSAIAKRWRSRVDPHLQGRLS
eukprot:2083099-Amphidinium_carterae.1